MVKINIGGCSSFVKETEYKNYLEKALQAFDVLESETGAGNDFLGWKHLPSGIFPAPDRSEALCRYPHSKIR